MIHTHYDTHSHRHGACTNTMAHTLRYGHAMTHTHTHMENAQRYAHTMTRTHTQRLVQTLWKTQYATHTRVRTH